MTFCPECGFNVAVDEDGCCKHCGATAMGAAVDALPSPTAIAERDAVIAQLRAALETLLDSCGRAVQEAKHHHRGRGQPLAGAGGIDPGLLRVLHGLEEN
jgi:hypothetical protein